LLQKNKRKQIKNTKAKKMAGTPDQSETKIAFTKWRQTISPHDPYGTKETFSLLNTHLKNNPQALEELDLSETQQQKIEQCRKEHNL
jgi:hypothetical protein